MHPRTAPRIPAAAEGDLGLSQGWSQQRGPWRVRTTSENQLVIESQQVEEPGWAGPEQVAWGTLLDHRGAGDAGQKLHFHQEGKGDLSRKWKVTEGNLSGQWERQMVSI